MQPLLQPVSPTCITILLWCVCSAAAGIVRTTTLKGVGGESGSGCGSLFLLGCTKAAAPEQTHHKTIVIPVGNIGCSSECIRVPSVP